MEKLVELIVKELVDNKDDVAVTIAEDGEMTIVNVKVNEADLGKVIGKQGKTANAIRTLVKSIANKNLNKRLTVKFSE